MNGYQVSFMQITRGRESLPYAMQLVCTTQEEKKCIPTTLRACHRNIESREEQNNALAPKVRRMQILAMSSLYRYIRSEQRKIKSLLTGESR